MDAAFGVCLMVLSCSIAAGPAAAIRIEGEQAELVIKSDLVGRYRFKGEGLAKPYLWPVNGPSGTPVTRAWPMEPVVAGGSTDHVHQKSAWFCHGDVIPEGVKFEKVKGVEGVDFWSETRGHGWIVCTQARSERDRLLTHNEWRTSAGQKILDEERVIRLLSVGDARLIVFDIDLEASVVPVTFGDTKEGAFGVRVNDAIRVGKGGRIENADGKIGEAACWGHKSVWCDYSGPINGNTAGIAILDDPGNPYPACWHVRAYGLMAANPFGRDRSGFPAMRGKTELVSLEKGKHLKLRYGLLLHMGNAHDGKVAECYQQFIEMR
jgi:hypothetical protein